MTRVPSIRGNINAQFQPDKSTAQITTPSIYCDFRLFAIKEKIHAHMSAVADSSSGTIAVDHQDTAHNPATQDTRSFKKDTLAPSFTLTNPIADFPINNANVASVNFSGSCSDNNENIVFNIPGFTARFTDEAEYCTPSDPNPP